jgi:hypothetical protein
MDNHYFSDLLSYSAACHMLQELIEVTKELLTLIEALGPINKE